MLGLGKITKDDLKMIGFKRLGFRKWIWKNDNNFNIIIVDVSEVENPHVSVECLNDSMEVPNAKHLSDLTCLQTLFK